MWAPRKRHGSVAPLSWLQMLLLSCVGGGLFSGWQAEDFQLLNRSAAVLLLAIALACVRNIFN